MISGIELRCAMSWHLARHASKQMRGSYEKRRLFFSFETVYGWFPGYIWVLPRVARCFITSLSCSGAIT